VQRRDLLDKGSLGTADILDRLARHRLGQKANEVAGMAGGKRDADLAILLHAADPRPVPGARVDDDEGRLRPVHLEADRRQNADQHIVDRSCQRAAVEDDFRLKYQRVRRELLLPRHILIAALPQHVEEQGSALVGIDQVIPGLG